MSNNLIANTLFKTVDYLRDYLKYIIGFLIFIYILSRILTLDGIILLNNPISNGHLTNNLINYKSFEVIKPSKNGIQLPKKKKCPWFYYLNPLNLQDILSLFYSKPSELDKVSANLEFTYQIWLNISNISENLSWNDDFDLPKILLNRGYSPIILYVPKSNNLQIGMRTNNTEQITFYELENFFKIQKWSLLSIGLQNRNLDIYLNDKLVQSYILPGVPFLNNDSIYLFQDYGFFAKVSLIMYFKRCLNPNEIEKYYNMNSRSYIPKLKYFHIS